MKSIYLIRHQQAGILEGYAFDAPPTAEEMEKLASGCAARFGYGHPKYNDPNFAHFAGEDHPEFGKPYWVKVEEWKVAPSVDALAESLKEPMRRAAAAGGNDGKAEVVVVTGGVGTVTNPGE